MQVPVINRKSALSLCLVALLALFGMPVPVWANLSTADAGRLDRFENTVFGQERHQLSDESRIRALEINLFGQAKSGNRESRLEAIDKFLGKPSTAKYLPPVAASMDRSAFAPAKKPALKSAMPAPAPAAGGEQPLYAPEPASAAASGNEIQPGADQSEREKDLLRQALERHNQGDMNGAEQLFKQVLATNPRNVDANFNLGAMLEDEGNLNDALHYYQTAAKLSPGDHDIQQALSAVRDKLNHAQVAQQTQAQIEHKLQLKQIADDAGAAYKAGRYDQAISDLNRIAGETPDDPNVQYGLGQAWRGKGDLGRARQYLSRALALSPNNQLYKSTLSDLDHDVQKQVSEDGPPLAPDYTRGAGNRNSAAAGQDFYNSNGGAQANADAPNGGVQPFTDQGEGTLYGHEMANGMGNMGMGGGMGMGMGLGALGAMGMGRLMSGPHYYGGTGTRLMRGAIGGALSGAAIGALTNMHGAGGSRAGAMRGALYGGLFGLMTGF